MNKRVFLAVGALLAAVGLGWLLVRWFSARTVSVPAASDTELARLHKQLFPNSPIQPSVLPTAQLPASRRVRLAIGALGSPDDAQTANLADLLTAELTGASGIELVERNAIRKVLAELELSRSGLVRAKDAVRVGKLVHADWFLLGSRHQVSAGADVLVLRMVDARTGIMRDVTVLAGASDLRQTASEAGEFVRQCRQAASAKAPQPRLLLGIGSFADVGINSRQAAFPDQLRSYLTMAFRHSTATLVERESVAALLDEVRLDLAGLADEETGPMPPLQSAFWLVDGCFQSYETAGLEVEVMLRVTRIFGRSTTSKLHGPPDETFFRRIKEAVDAAIAQGTRQMVVPTRRSEIRVQMKTGEELFSVATGGHQIELPGPAGYYANQSFAQRAFDLREAIRCFQTALVLDPTNRQARFYVAACLLDPSLDSLEEARNGYRELANSAIHDKWACQAAWTLALSYTGKDDREAANWFLKAAQLGPSKFFTEQASNAMAEALKAEAHKTGSVSTQALAAAEWQLVQQIGEVANIIWGKGGGHLDLSFGFEPFVEFYGTNVQAAAQRASALLPTLVQKFPDMEPYLVACAAGCQTDTNAPLVAQFRKSLAACRQRPEEITAAPLYFEVLLHFPYKWCMDNRLFSMAAELVEAKRDAAHKVANLGFTSVDQLKLAFTYVRREQWAEAQAAFEQAGDLAIETGGPGPWGDAYCLFLPGKAAAQCRAKLGRPQPQRADRFDFGKPCLCLHTPSAVAGTEDALWVGISGSLYRLNLDLSTNLQIRLPPEAGPAPITALVVGPSSLWVGTAGAGLIEVDKASRKPRHWTQDDGLLLNEISCLCLDGQTLWIGFGQEDADAGGVGKLDLATSRFTMFTAPIARMPEVAAPHMPAVVDYQRQADVPPRLTLRKIDVSPDQVWTISAEGIRTYCPSSGAWKLLSLPGGMHPTAFLPAPEQVTVAFEAWAHPMEPVARVKIPPEPAGTPAPDNASAGAGHPTDFQAAYPLHSCGIANCSFTPRQWSMLTENGSTLPAAPTSVLAHGQDLWLAGPGYVAVFDRRREAPRRICPIEGRSVDSLHVFGGYVWAKFNRHLYRAPLAATQ